MMTTQICETKKDKIAQIIYDWLPYVYCDDCRYSTEIEHDDYNDSPCEDCYRKYMGWGISKKSAANRIAKDILKLEDEK